MASWFPPPSLLPLMLDFPRPARPLASFHRLHTLWVRGPSFISDLEESWFSPSPPICVDEMGRRLESGLTNERWYRWRR